MCLPNLPRASQSFLEANGSIFGRREHAQPQKSSRSLSTNRFPIRQRHFLIRRLPRRIRNEHSLIRRWPPNSPRSSANMEMLFPNSLMVPARFFESERLEFRGGASTHNLKNRAADANSPIFERELLAPPRKSSRSLSKQLGELGRRISLFADVLGELGSHRRIRKVHFLIRR
jgi:hypothetical protein